MPALRNRIVKDSDPKLFLIYVSEDPSKEVTIRVRPLGFEPMLVKGSDISQLPLQNTK